MLDSTETAQRQKAIKSRSDRPDQNKPFVSPVVIISALWEKCQLAIGKV